MALCSIVTSKRRKTRCDKIQPCVQCITRGQGDQCTFEQEATPRRGSEGISIHAFAALQSRVDILESQKDQEGRTIQLIATPPVTKFSPSASPQLDRPANHEKAFSLLYGLATAANVHHLVSSSQATSPSSLPTPSWPNIRLSSHPTSSVRWIRDMTELFDAIPQATILSALVDYYFREVQAVRELMLGASKGFH